MVLRTLHLCSGYDGAELALRLAGVPTRTVAHVERDSHAAACLVARMEDEALDRAPVWSDLNTFDTAPWVGRVDLVTAGFPCQPFSAADLNPRFVAALMGVPWDWLTPCTSVGTDSYRSWLRTHSPSWRIVLELEGSRSDD